jgi:ParB-like chromosome segregation protein Spo0J
MSDTTEIAPERLSTGHEVRESAKVEDLAQSMITNGWQGAPIVAWVDFGLAITGVHRLAAAIAAGLEVVPVMDIAELAAEHDVDLTDDDAPADLWAQAMWIAEQLPSEVTEALGLDLQ